MTLNLFLSESTGFHSLHRPGWAIVEARLDSARYHAPKIRVNKAPGARGKTGIDSYLTAPTGPHRRVLRRSFEPVSRLEGWLMSPGLHRSRKGLTCAFEENC